MTDIQALKHMKKVEIIISNQTKASDVGNANHLKDKFKDKIRYCPELGSWLIYDGLRWIEDTGYQMYEFAKETCNSLHESALNCQQTHEKEDRVKHALRSEQFQRIKAMIELAKSIPDIQISISKLDSQPHLINTLSGTYNLIEGILTPHAPSQYITKLADVEYSPNAKADKFHEFISSIFVNDPDLINSVQKILGYSITGYNKEHMLVIFNGDGANGKSTLVSVILKILGDYGKQIPSSVLLAGQKERHPTEAATLKGCRFAATSETDTRKAFDEAQIKALTGGDRITARFMNKDFIEFEPTHTIILSTNILPEIRGVDNGIWRRIKVIPFLLNLSDEMIDINLQDKLLAEASGLFNWIAEGAKKWHSEGLNDSKAMKEAKALYRDESNVLRDFLDECCIENINNKCLHSQLYDSYKIWCANNGERQVSSRTLGDSLKARGFYSERKGKGKTFRVGISLK